MPSLKFKRDLKRGQPAEQYVAKMYESWGLRTRVVDGFFQDYDIESSGNLKGKQVYFLTEVKYDIKEKETGRLYLDIESLKKSKASILTICLNDPIDTVLMLPLDKALSFALKHQNVTGGDYKETSCLVRKDIFIQELKPQVLTTKQ
jgi:hypothetical protein